MARIKSLVNENTNRLNHKRPAFTKGTETVSLTEAQSGETIIVGPAAAGVAASTIFSLPAAKNGMCFKFVYVGGAADAEQFQINTTADANYFIGGIFQTDPGGNDGLVYHPDLNSNSRCFLKTPDAGTWAEVWCDGTNWFINGWSTSATDTGVVFSDQSL